MSAVQMRLRARREARRIQQRAEWFGKHVATLRIYKADNGTEIEHLRWARPATGTYAITYHAMGSTLVVTGDMYEGVYRVSDRASLKWWGRCNIDYFAGKCLASPDGRGYREWVHEEAVVYTRRMLAERETKVRREFKDRDGWQALSSKQEWYFWLNDNGYEVFGDDFYEYAADVGERISFQCEAHLFGLKLALAQLNIPAAA